MAKVAVVYHSGFGHTKLQAEAVLRGAASVPGVSAAIYTAEEAIVKLDELDAADAIIFGSPTYMGSMSAKMKEFVEAAAKNGSRSPGKTRSPGRSPTPAISPATSSTRSSAWSSTPCSTV